MRPVAESGFGGGQVVLKRTDNSTVESGFYVERRLRSRSVFSRIAMLGPNTKAYTDSGLSSGNQDYRVQAFKPSAEVTGCSNTAGVRAK